MQAWNSTPPHSSFASNSLGLSSSGFAALQVAGLPYSLKSMLQQMAKAPVLKRQPWLNDSSSRDLAHICLRRHKKPHTEATQASCRALGTPSLGGTGIHRAQTFSWVRRFLTGVSLLAGQKGAALLPTVFHLSLLICNNDMLNTSERSLFFL